MGSVWMAQQQKPVKRLVAVKLIKAGMDSKAVLARFEAERQALALMDHPHIAKVLDAGAAPDGRPYFVMELVKGVPITQYCDEHRLTPRQRLELFVPVCAAIQHAHHKGIIHRDVKPSNVLVALYDDRPVPKVIDFGVAKATGPRLTERTLHTGFGAVVGTVEYMSPEQASFNQLDIDTRSDVYALGVLLYELLTGTTPLEHKRAQEAGLLEALRIIREEEPPTLSNRLGTTEELASIAASRSLEPKKLSGLVRGELNWMVMKCLEKDRNRRYDSANGLALDVQRYLQDEPVQACPPSLAYRFRKFVRRNKGAVLAAAGLVALLLGGIVGTGLGLVQARAERDEKEKARQQADANFHGALRAVDQFYTVVSENTLLRRPDLEPMREQLLREALRYYEGFVHDHADDPRLQGELVAAHLRIGNLLWTLGQDWFTPFQKAVAILEELLPRNPDATALRAVLAGVYRPAGAHLPLYPYEADQLRRIFDKACALWEELARAHPTAPGLRNDPACWSHVRGMVLAYRYSQHEEAVRAYRRGCELREELMAAYPNEPRYPASLVMPLYNWGESQEELGQLSEARQTQRRALELMRKLAAQFPEDAGYQQHLAWLCAQYGPKWEAYGRLQEAEEAGREALAAYENLARAFPAVPRYPGNVLEVLASLGNLLWRSGRRAEAVEAYRRAAALADKVDPTDPGGLDCLAWFLATCPDPQFQDAGRAVDLAKKAIASKPQAPEFRTTLGVAHYRAGDWPAAIEVLGEAVKIQEWFDGTPCFFLAMAHWQLGKKAEARQWYARAVRLHEKTEAKEPEGRRFRDEAEALMKQERGDRK
jgi:eukaryotic-like serine/threonine-protein kinase